MSQTIKLRSSTTSSEVRRVLASHRGQAMIETVLAVIIVTFVFLTLFKLSHALTGKILLEHAAMRVARARAVGLNGFMCVKTARVAILPVAGERTWPAEDDGQEDGDEVSRARLYMMTPDGAYADGLLQYENWPRLGLTCGSAGDTHTSLKTDWFDLKGEAVLDSFPVYMNDMGL